MRVLELHSENIEKIKVVDITPQDDIVVLSGKNGAGKSSVLNSIEYALTGKHSERPIRDGEKKATIKVDLGEYTIERVFTEKSSRLELLSKEGHIVKTPQAVLNSLCGKLTFDPLEFAKMKAKDRRDLLLELIGLDFDTINEKRQALYDHRTMIGREGSVIKGQLQSFEDVDFADTPDDEISIIDLNEKYLQVRKEIEDQNAAKIQIAELDNAIEHLQKEKKEIEGKIKNAIAQKDLKTKSLSKVSVEDLVLRQNSLYTDLADAESTNKKIRQKQEWKVVSENYKAKQKEYQDCTDEIANLDAEKLSMIESAEMPISDLSFVDDDVLYQNIPFSQLSSGEELTVSLAIAMAMNPTLRIIRITDGSLLDSEHMEIIREMATEKDYQVWIERVDESGEVGIYFEEGEIKSKN